MYVHFLVEVESEILKSNIDEAQLQRLRNGELPGALWHLFRADDVKKIRQYLNRVPFSRPFLHPFVIDFLSRSNERVQVRIPFMIKQLIWKRKIWKT